MSLSAVNGALSNLKSCLADIATGMDIVTDVAIDVVESQGKHSEPASFSLETMILDCDIAVTQSQVNFTCPLTQVEMLKPVKNKKCNHYYDESAILDLIKTKRNLKKKCRCPVVGCENTDVKESDLVLDQILRRRIQNQKKKNSKN
uniref:E3 SUMO-protein ligase NSE2 n=1 Tax=Oryzias sinensis TaxID=183150 RepID=A0A8C7XC34_9TELE